MLTLSYRRFLVLDLAFGGVVTIACIALASSLPTAAALAAVGFVTGVVAARVGDGMSGLLGLAAGPDGRMSVGLFALLCLAQVAVVASLSAVVDPAVGATIAAFLVASSANGLAT